MSYIGPITSTKEEDEERNRRQDEIVQQVWKPIGSTLNFIGDTQEAVDQVVMPQRRKSIDAASQFVGEQTGSKGLQIGTSILGEFAPDSIDVLLAGAALSGVGTVPALGAIGLRKAMRLHRASKVARKTAEVTESINDTVKYVKNAFTRDEAGMLIPAMAGGAPPPRAFEPNTVMRHTASDDLMHTLHPKKGGGDKLAREVLSGDNLTGDALELKNIILDQQKALANAPIAELADGTKTKVSSLSKAEVEALGVRIRTLKENLGLKSTSKYETYTGAFVIDGHIARLNSKGKLVTTKQQASRDLLEKLFPADESLLQDRYNISSKAGLTHKHHVRILEPSKVFGVVSDGKGGFVPRDAGQLDRVTKRLREVDNIHLGNQDLHEIMQSRLAHLGEKGDELSKYASHVQARNLTDLQGRTLADADFLQVVLKKGDGNPVWVQQVKNKEGIITDFKLRNGDSIKAGNIKETLKYKLHGKTYDPKAVHGFSEEGIELLTSIKGDDDLYEAIKLFYQTTDEGFKGVAGVASKLIDKGKTVDSLTKELLVQYSPEVQNWIKYMQTLPQFKNDRRLLEVMLQNKLDLYKLDLRYERPLKSLPKSDGRRHIGGR